MLRNLSISAVQNDNEMIHLTIYNKQLILDSKNTEVYSYELVYNYFKLVLFKSLETGNDIDLSSNDFKVFKPDDLIRIFSVIDSEFFNYLLDNIQ